MGRFGTVEEIAKVVVMLASNGYITGQTINVNGMGFRCARIAPHAERRSGAAVRSRERGACLK